MKWKDMLLMALGNLFKRKVRTLLTVMGVVIGTCAIVVMLSFGIGIKQSMETMMQNMGDLTVITINNSSQTPDSPALDDKTLEKVKAMKDVVAVTPVFYLDPSVVTIKSRKYNYQGMIYGVSMSALKEFGYQAENGTLPAESAPETTILFGKDAEYDFIDGQKSSNNMIFPQADKNGKMPDPYVSALTDKFEAVVNLPEDSTAKTKPIKLQCAATLVEDWGKNPSPSHCVFMDVTFAKQLRDKYNKLNNIKKDPNKKDGYDSASVKVASVEAVPDAEKAIQDMGFSTYSMESVRKPLEEQMRTIQMILGGLGAISLLVAALGITNTMIMSIYERTREIGIMKVLGCVVRNIRTMFLIEAGAIGFMGGVIGIAQSYAISLFINTLYASQAAGNGNAAVPATGGAAVGISIIPLWLALGALLFSTMVGLVSGFYPANRAVKISALTAIKQE
ncbi:ABC transporter permease [Caproiciproducens faecalis]|uniref:ABC transporter permease n=1 Tax=Caproiciproducens faecalis TaxID=2820301 RepID=A0ABS7DRK8_9FIRM|nr:ABC transporter permease [Caproiciproducens faecalis]MBW7573934.1 ABC transporter permease [Caproiciproducens faecalis]